MNIIIKQSKNFCFCFKILRKISNSEFLHRTHRPTSTTNFFLFFVSYIGPWEALRYMMSNSLWYDLTLNELLKSKYTGLRVISESTNKLLIYIIYCSRGFIQIWEDSQNNKNEKGILINKPKVFYVHNDLKQTLKKENIFLGFSNLSHTIL